MKTIIFIKLKKKISDGFSSETLSNALDAVLERTQDFTDSAYTSHEHRQSILNSSERLKSEVDHLQGLFANVVGSLECSIAQKLVFVLFNL